MLSLITYFAEPTGHHHSASVTVSAITFVCTNTNLLTYFDGSLISCSYISCIVILFVLLLLCTYGR